MRGRTSIILQAAILFSLTASSASGGDLVSMGSMFIGPTLNTGDRSEVYRSGFDGGVAYHLSPFPNIAIGLQAGFGALRSRDFGQLSMFSIIPSFRMYVNPVDSGSNGFVGIGIGGGSISGTRVKEAQFIIQFNGGPRFRTGDRSAFEIYVNFQVRQSDLSQNNISLMFALTYQ
jgi:hypothetical protein